MVELHEAKPAAQPRLARGLFPAEPQTPARAKGSQNPPRHNRLRPLPGRTRPRPENGMMSIHVVPALNGLSEKGRQKKIARQLPSYLSPIKIGFKTECAKLMKSDLPIPGKRSPHLS